jgi:hypothetical protein
MMKFVKNRLRNRMNDGLLDDCLVTFIEQDIFLHVKEEDIINCFMAIRWRRPDMSKKWIVISFSIHYIFLRHFY